MSSIRADVAILNRSTVASDEEVKAITEALGVQVTYHFGPRWNTNAKLTFIPRGQDTGWQGKWNLVVLDTSDEADALGYHDYTPEGKPLGKAFAKTDKLYGSALSVTMSHELLEMLGDPAINRLADDGRGRLYAYENCDAVEADELGYKIGGILVSDFVTPEWFASSLYGHKDIAFSHGKHVHNPFELAAGGYISYTDTWPANWQQQFAAGTSPDTPGTRPRLGSRRERRRTPRPSWRRSNA